MKLTIDIIVKSVKEDFDFLMNPLFEYWSEHYYTVYGFFIALAIMLNQLLMQ